MSEEANYTVDIQGHGFFYLCPVIKHETYESVSEAVLQLAEIVRMAKSSNSHSFIRLNSIIKTDVNVLLDPAEVCGIEILVNRKEESNKEVLFG